MKKNVLELQKCDKIKFEIGDFDIFVEMEVDKIEPTENGKVKVWGTVLKTMITICKVGDYDYIEFPKMQMIETI